MRRNTVVALIVGACLGIAGTLLVTNTFADSLKSIGTFFAGDKLEVPDSVATTSDTFVAEADCLDIIQPDSVQLADVPRIILPEPQREGANERKGRRLLADHPEKVSEGGSGVIVDSEALQRRIQERANQDRVPWYYAEWDTTTQFYDLKVGIFSASPRPIIVPQLDYHNDIWYRMFMEERINRSLTKQRWKGRVEGALTTAAIFGIVSAFR